MKKLLNTVLIALVAIAVVPLILWIAGIFGPFAHGADVFGGADIMLVIAGIYLVLAVVVLIAMTLLNMGKGRSNSRLSLYVFGGLAVLAVVFYFLFGNADPVTDAGGKVYADAFTLKATDMMLYLAYATLAGCVVFLLYGTIRNALK